MRPLAEIRSCLAVGDDDMADATRDGPDAKGRALSLLGRMCEVARPGDGAPKILLLLARMADRSWVGGRLEARIRADADWCTMDLFVDDELEVRRFAPTLAIAAPVGELLQAVERVPGAIEPLTLQEGASRERFRLRASRLPPKPKAKGLAATVVRQAPARPDVAATVKVAAMVIPKAAVPSLSRTPPKHLAAGIQLDRGVPREDDE